MNSLNPGVDVDPRKIFEFMTRKPLSFVQIYELVSPQMVSRLFAFPAMRTAKVLSTGWGDAPTGEVCLSFTFLVGSDALLQWNKRICRSVLQSFEDISRELLLEYEGYQVEAADGLFLSAFSCPANSILWALSVHEALAQEPWCVRYKCGS